MADLSGYTPIYIRTTGDDDTGDGSSGSPYRSAQKGYDVAMAAGSGNYVLDFGVGPFGNVNTGGFGVVNVSGSWPARIAVRGVSATQSYISGIEARGVDGYYDGDTSTEYPPVASSAVTIVSDKSITIGNVYASGGAYDSGSGGTSKGGAGGAITLTDCVTYAVESNGGSGAFTGGGNAGAITLSGCDVSGGVSANGGPAEQASEHGGNAAAVTLTDTTVSGSIAANGGAGYGAGANVTLTRSSCTTISCNATGPNQDCCGAGAVAGSVSITDSSCGAINANGGTGGYDNQGGHAGSVTIVGSSCGAINANGGTGGENYHGGDGGAVSATDSFIGNVSAGAGGPGNAGCSQNNNGSVTLAGTGNVPNVISAGSVTTTNLKKGRGVNGSNILSIV